MKTKPSVNVTKKLAEEDKLNSQRWLAFCNACSVDWESLSPQLKDFFYLAGETSCTMELLNMAIDKALEN